MGSALHTTIAIKPRCGKRAKSGHPWIFSNEINHPQPLMEAGTLISVIDDGGNFVGYATYNPHSLISLRILSRDPDVIPGTQEWFINRIQRALALRQRLYPHRRSYRLIYGDSDGISGVIVDRYENILVVQILTAGMEKLTEPLLTALQQALAPAAVVLRNQNEKRKLENLPLYTQIKFGEVPDEVEIEENGVHLLIDVKAGQKTGHFFDQADNRQALAKFAPDLEILDLFCHTGAWALQLLASGAKRAVAVDISAPALALAQRNAQLNHCANRMECVEADAFSWLAAARQEKLQFDLVVVDPPAFAKNAKQVKAALRGYEDINRQSLHLVRDGGIFCTCSCSSFITEEMFLSLLQRAAAREKRDLQILEFRSQAQDHPVLLSMPESRYLKCVIGVVQGRGSQ